MKTSPVTPADLSASVLSVPPLARKADLSLNPDANRALIRHLEAGGVRTLMYGGNANFYNIGRLRIRRRSLDFLAEAAGKDTWVIPSAGPDFGKLMDQARDPARRASSRRRWCCRSPRAIRAPMHGAANGHPPASPTRSASRHRLREGRGLHLTPETTAALLNDGTAAP